MASRRLVCATSTVVARPGPAAALLLLLRLLHFRLLLLVVHLVVSSSSLLGRSCATGTDDDAGRVGRALPRCSSCCDSAVVRVGGERTADGGAEGVIRRRRGGRGEASDSGDGEGGNVAVGLAVEDGLLGVVLLHAVPYPNLDHQPDRLLLLLLTLPGAGAAIGDDDAVHGLDPVRTAHHARVDRPLIATAFPWLALHLPPTRGTDTAASRITATTGHRIRTSSRLGGGNVG